MTPEKKPASAGFRYGAAAAVCYLAVALWAMRVVLPHPTTLLAYPAAVAHPWREMYQSDEQSVVWAVTRHAHVFLSGHLDRDRDHQCFPMPHAYTLGESMLLEGAAAVVPFALSHDPVFTMNAVVVAWLWIAALSMYALVYAWTGSPSAAFVAGLLFGFDPSRIADPAHPSVHGNLWTPLALLYAQRTFAAGRWRDVAGLAGALVLQLLESFYQVLALAILGSVYGVYLAVRHARRLPLLVPRLLAVVAIVGAAMVLIFGPYLHTAETWQLLSGRTLYFVPLEDFGVGRLAYPGTVVLLLALVALADRVRGARRFPDHDPRLVLFAGALAVAWAIVPEVPVPGTGIAVPSLAYALERVPGVSAVRGIANLHCGINLVVALLAGFGTVALLEGRGRRARRVIAVTIVALALLETFYAPPAMRTEMTSANLAAFPARPAPDALDVYRGLPDGAVLDLPFAFDLRGMVFNMSYYLMLGAYHERAVAACYNSFKGPLQREVEALAKRLPQPSAADALYALGFRTLVVHRHLEARDADTVRGLTALEGRTHLERAVGRHVRFTLSTPLPIDPDLRALEGGNGPDDVADVAPPRADLAFAFRNHAAGVYCQPAPIEPSDLVVRWQPEAGGRPETSRTRALLPPALGQGETTVRTIDVGVPSTTGIFEVTLAPATAPDLVIARRRARVGTDQGAAAR